MTESIPEQSIAPQEDSDLLRAKAHAESSTPAVERAGRILAHAREKQGMSVADAAHALRLGVKQIEALEADDFGKLPGRTFVRGFIRNYARLLQLDPERLVTISSSSGEAEAESRLIQAPSQQIRFSEHHAKPWLKWLAAAFVVVALVSWVVLEWLGPEQAKRVTTPKPTSSAASDLPAQAVETPSTGSAPAQRAVAAAQPAMAPAVEALPLAQTQTVSASPILAPLSLVFSGPAWVEVRDRNGKKIYAQTSPAGTTQLLEGEPPLTLAIGSAPNVTLTYKGQPVDLAAYTKADVARLTLE